ncbi:hypothetical protein AX16_002293 [Volvariella volvacea WC 439]|nr:hypothetical protein AX16_002293 [Volvariella volvacea WC 439]
MTLSNGLYLIKNGAYFVGRSPAEDLSLRPKRILLLPEGVTAPRWEVESTGEHYILKAQGAPTTSIGGEVYALLVNEDGAEKWKLEKDVKRGDNFYVISSNNGSTGWIAPSDPEKQIACHAQIVGMSLPPTYPGNESFEFIRIDRED